MPMRPKVFRPPGWRPYIEHSDHSSQVGDRPETLRAATLISDHLKGLHVDLIGIDGLPCSGKSTLARALASRMSMRWVPVEYRLAKIDLDQVGVIYEHHRLFRTQDLDRFDVLIYLDEPLVVIKGRVASRGREGDEQMLADYYFPYMQSIGRRAFSVARCDIWRVPESNILLKCRPPEGFRDRERLEAEAKATGFRNVQNASKEDLIRWTRHTGVRRRKVGEAETNTCQRH